MYKPSNIENSSRRILETNSIAADSFTSISKLKLNWLKAYIQVHMAFSWQSTLAHALKHTYGKVMGSNLPRKHISLLKVSKRNWNLSLNCIPSFEDYCDIEMCLSLEPFLNAFMLYIYVVFKNDVSKSDCMASNYGLLLNNEWWMKRPRPNLTCYLYIYLEGQKNVKTGFGQDRRSFDIYSLLV